MSNVTASQVMTAEVLSVGPDWTVERLVEFLVDHTITGAPVVSDHGMPIGVVSLTDIARSGLLGARSESAASPYFTEGLERRLGHEELGRFRIVTESQTTVREIMTSVVFSVDEHAPVQEVAEAMITGRIHRVLVTRGKKLVGIVSSMDLLPLVRDL